MSVGDFEKTLEKEQQQEQQKQQQQEEEEQEQQQEQQQEEQQEQQEQQQMDEVAIPPSQHLGAFLFADPTALSELLSSVGFDEIEVDIL